MTGGDVLQVGRDNPVVVSTIYQTGFIHFPWILELNMTPFFKVAGGDWLPVCSVLKAYTAWVFLLALSDMT